MPTLQITQTSLKTLQFSAEKAQILYFDDKLKGFGVLCSSKTQTRTFILQRSLPGGKTRRLTIGRADVLSVEAARTKAKKQLSKFYDGVDPVAERRQEIVENKKTAAEQTARATRLSYTLQNALDDYLSLSRFKPKTKTSYKAFVERNLKDWLDLPLCEITRDMAVLRHAEITSLVIKRSGAKRSLVNGHAMANGTMRVLRALWNDARERVPELPENPVRSFRRVWHREVRRTRYVKPGDLPKFVKAVQSLKNPIQRNYVLLLLFTGLRRNEAAELKWSEVDYVGRIIHLAAERTKASRALDLPMTDYVFSILKECEKEGRQGEYVFPSPTSKSGHIEEPKNILDAIEKSSGIKATCHDLRRTFITVAESCDISPYALKGLVNHSYGQDVTSGYIVSNAERLREPMNKVTDKLLSLIGAEQREKGHAPSVPSHEHQEHHSARIQNIQHIEHNM